MKTLASLILLIFLSVSNSLYSQEKLDNDYNWSFAVNSGLSFLFPLEYSRLITDNTSLERATVSFSLKIDRSRIGLTIGKDRFYEDYVYTTPNSYESRRGYITQYFMGLSYTYSFWKPKESEIYAGMDLLFNDERSFLNLRLGIIKPIYKHLSMNVNLRNMYDCAGTFEVRAGYQVGMDFGLMYNF